MKPRIAPTLLLPLSLFSTMAVCHAATNTWTNGSADSAWNGTSANWTAPTTWANGDDAVFGATGIGTVTVGSGVTANKLTFSSTGYTLAGGPLTLTGPEIATAASTDTTISSVLQGSVGLTKSGAGTLRLTGTNGYTGTTLITGGSLLASNASGTAFTGNVTIGNTAAASVLTATQANQFASGSALTFANGTLDAKFQLRGTTQTVASLNSATGNTLSILQNDESGTAGYGVGGGTGTLIVNNSSASLFDGIIRNGGGAAPGVLNLTKTGSGTLTILNTTTITGNAYTGITTVSGGLLQFGNSTATRKGISTGALQIDAGGSVLLWYANSQTYANTISGSGKLDFRSNSSATSLGLNEHVITGTANSGFSGAITVTDSRLRLQTATSPLGNASAGNTVAVLGNGQLMLNAVGTYNYNINIGSLGYYETTGAQLGALRLELGAIQAGTVTLTGNAGIGSQDPAPGIIPAVPGAGGVISGVISQSGGSFGITKLGLNNISLTAANTYTGSTVVQTGTLTLSGNGSISASSTIDVKAGAALNVAAVSGGWSLGASQTLTGSGTVTGDFTVAGTLSPGASPGTLNIGGTLTLATASVWNVEIGGTAAGQFDQLLATGGLNAGGIIALKWFGGYTPVGGESFNIADFTTLTNNGYTFDTTGAPLAPGQSWNFSGFESAGIVSVIPESSSALLAGVGAIFLLRRRRLR